MEGGANLNNFQPLTQVYPIRQGDPQQPAPEDGVACGKKLYSSPLLAFHFAFNKLLNIKNYRLAILPPSRTQSHIKRDSDWIAIVM
jgi:hypothetical protein